MTPLEKLREETALIIVGNGIAGEAKPALDALDLYARAYAAQAIKDSGAVEALEPVAAFMRAFDKKPIRLADEFYAIHSGTEWESGLRLSDMRKADSALLALRKIVEGAP
jgi:hypothetical protein